ncbi:hypothetical protein F511_27871 [Dorcoceras hygrometricum]|uniref:Uncharacterized protein n=1 Tax=Dorcoceras hygrometricum TaxID=472368 RepID=A0A2Z7AWU1_9LAMI|nr:hypothetical protein F511_27871 [Dorcoceras hygrometricum]
MLISFCVNVNKSDVDEKRNLESVMMTSAFLLEEAVISNDDVSIADGEEVVISNYDVSYISRQLDGSVMMISVVMSSQSAVDKRSPRDGVIRSAKKR